MQQKHNHNEKLYIAARYRRAKLINLANLLIMQFFKITARIQVSKFENQFSVKKRTTF